MLFLSLHPSHTCQASWWVFPLPPVLLPKSLSLFRPSSSLPHLHVEHLGAGSLQLLPLYLLIPPILPPPSLSYLSSILVLALSSFSSIWGSCASSSQAEPQPRTRARSFPVPRGRTPSWHCKTSVILFQLTLVTFSPILLHLILIQKTWAQFTCIKSFISTSYHFVFVIEMRIDGYSKYLFEPLSIEWWNDLLIH